MVQDRNWTVRKLFGGTIEVNLPEEFEDMSDVRLVPDYQEVFADADTDRSVIIECMQLGLCGPERAATWHFENLVSEMEAQNSELQDAAGITQQEAVNLDMSKVSPTKALGTIVAPKFRDEIVKANTVEMSIACLRLTNVTTDLLITVNCPLFIHSESSAARDGASIQNESNNPSERRRLFEGILSSFKILDWSLFGH
uniref:Ran guanine nucleotide release factor n=1 Tax=Rhodosorus marinus TaxID=101924 RepID=A0A7S0BEY5_9RHOD|mmetsp:Transcript_13304/g.19169  ORF Transcript_13304/g.19169 Transcript_13304/m.19169 type:complete len:198 (+) Transcript_13304:321-914(+)|eukprot:CAMPEP_0184754450 /NCGR_PEP_ID=MMETSP0315-20130426/44630_1 /TAXON_ID=101924 /ORGANISM="Rhodosorus marinus, Strain UTEX LB 2760" /LENGTH=197 /DNA_ID=CAMNT_0027233873 /DNA_START=808 /DNA_END=1401 /DNA_ORIENTATION=-